MAHEACKLPQLVTVALVPFEMETNLPVTPSTIWVADVSKEAKGAYGDLNSILNVSAKTVGFDKFDLALVRVGVRWSDKTEGFIDKHGVFLRGNSCIQLSDAQFKRLRKTLKSDWYFKAAHLPTPR